MALSGVISNGSIILFVSEEVPPEFITPVFSAGNQPADQRTQGYPQARGFTVVHGILKEEMGVAVDELMQ